MTDTEKLEARFANWAGRIMAAEYAHKRAKGNDQGAAIVAAVSAMQKLAEVLGVEVVE